jgi:alkanesulfonate monooxygenase SsuD/methylene tetrahydromethanopterin reductase-like flavin-dependent oxidoreductase (luciferase family)
MPVHVACPGCAKALKVSDASVGKKCKCPGCGLIFPVQAPAAPPPPPPEQDVPFEIAAATCSRCGTKLDPAAQFCVGCGTYVATGTQVNAEALSGKKAKASRKKTALIISAVVFVIAALAAVTALFLFR